MSSSDIGHKFFFSFLACREAQPVVNKRNASAGIEVAAKCWVVLFFVGLGKLNLAVFRLDYFRLGYVVTLY